MSRLPANTIRCQLWLVLLAFVASPVLAAPANAKLVPVLITAAKKEFDGGNFERAGELYLQIWQQDNSLMVALNNAGRAYQMAGRLEKADELYRLYLQQPQAEPAGIAKVRGYQAELQVARADLKVEGAARAESEGKFALAAQLWHDAERLVPDRWPWVLRGARAEQQAGRPAEAAEGYQRYLAGASIDAPERAEALRWQGELPADLVEAAAAKVTGKPQPRSGGRLAGTVTLTAGVVLDVVAAGSWLWAHQIRSDVDAALGLWVQAGRAVFDLPSGRYAWRELSREPLPLDTLALPLLLPLRPACACVCATASISLLMRASAAASCRRRRSAGAWPAPPRSLPATPPAASGPTRR